MDRRKAWREFQSMEQYLHVYPCSRFTTGTDSWRGRTLMAMKGGLWRGWISWPVRVSSLVLQWLSDIRLYGRRSRSIAWLETVDIASHNFIRSLWLSLLVLMMISAWKSLICLLCRD